MELQKLSEIKLRAVKGKGFDHEIIDDTSSTGKPVAKVYVDLDGNRDLGWEMSRLFAASIDLLFALDDAYPEALVLKPFKHLLVNRP